MILMKTLIEDEIYKLCKEIQQKTSDYLLEYEKKRAEQISAFKELQEKQYQSALRMYQSELEYYKQALKTYESNIEREEIEYPKRVKEWEKNEEQRKKSIEQTYTQRVAAYEKAKRQYEESGATYLGATYSVPFPQKQTFVPRSKPIKHKYHKPSEPVPPKKPYENQSDMASSFLSRINFMFNDSFSERAIRQLRKIDLSNPENKDKAFKIIFRELYLNKRISMECSDSEGMGISPVLDGLYGEKLTVFELELCVFAGYKGNILHNLEIQAGNRTIQIDVLFITQKGIFVIESKNYSGSVSGAEYQNKWTLRTYRKDYNFYNPITQNQIHINMLSNIIHNTKIFSLIAFSEKCDLGYIDIHKQNVFVFNRYALHDVIKDIFSNEPDILSMQNVENITNILRQYCADDSEKNPNYKEPRSYYSSRSKVSEHPNASYQRRRKFKRRNTYNNYDCFDDDYEDDYYDDDYDEDDYDDDYDY